MKYNLISDVALEIPRNAYVEIWCVEILIFKEEYTEENEGMWIKAYRWIQNTISKSYGKKLDFLGLSLNLYMLAKYLLKRLLVKTKHCNLFYKLFITVL